MASIRHPIHVIEAAKIGAHVGTLPPAVLRQMFAHPLTDKGLRRSSPIGRRPANRSSANAKAAAE